MEPKPKIDSESECSLLESMEDNEEITNDSVSENINESKVQINGSCAVENTDNNEKFPELKQEGAEDSCGSSPRASSTPEVSTFPITTRKGHGLKKWKRIKRDADRDVNSSSIDNGKMAEQDLSSSRVNPSKRMQYAERRQKSEGSVSSTSGVIKNLDGFALLDDSSLGLGPSFAAGTDSENSEDRSSKSSTAASAPKMKYEKPVIMGFPRDKGRMKSLSGKNATHSVQRGVQGKGRIETTKKASGERVKIEKENSHSSMESDSRSSNFVFMQETYAVNNGIRDERPNDYEGDEVQGSGRQVNDGRGVYGKDGDEGYEDLSQEDAVANSSWGVKKGRSENHDSSRDQDPLDESIFALQSAQEALEKEVLKIKEISNNFSVDGSVSEICREFTDVEQKFQESSSEHLQHGEGSDSSYRALQSEVVETANRDVETEFEDLFKQKVEAEVEYLAITRTIQKLRVAAVDQITVLEEQKATQILDKLEDAENKAEVFKKEAEKLEIFCEDIVSADEILKLQKRVFKYSWCFLLQLILLIVVLGVFMLQLSPNYMEFVPT